MARPALLVALGLFHQSAARRQRPRDHVFPIAPASDQGPFTAGAVSLFSDLCACPARRIPVQRVGGRGDRAVLLCSEPGDALSAARERRLSTFHLRRSARFLGRSPRRTAVKSSLGRTAGAVAPLRVNTPLRIEITDDARTQIVAAAAWWAEHRPAATGAVLEHGSRISRTPGRLALTPRVSLFDSSM